MSFIGPCHYPFWFCILSEISILKNSAVKFSKNCMNFTLSCKLFLVVKIDFFKKGKAVFVAFTSLKYQSLLCFGWS